MGKGRGTVEGMARLRGSSGKPRQKFWKARKVLVTGGAGFIGFALARRLRDLGARVTIFDIKPAMPKHRTEADRKTLHYIRGSVTSSNTVRALIRREKIQTVFHLAAEALVGNALKSPVETLETNTQGTWVMLDEARKQKHVSEIVIASSDKAYGPQKKLPYRESSPLAGETPYDASKSAADLIAQMYGKTYRLPVAVARCGNVYGPGDTNWSRLIPDAFRSIATGKTLKLRSSGSHTRDYVYIDDVVQAYAVLAENVQKKKLFGEAFNFGTNHPLSVRDALTAIEKSIGRRIPRIFLNTAKNEIQSQYLDSAKARRILGWHPKNSRSEAFRKTHLWYQDFLTRHPEEK